MAPTAMAAALDDRLFQGIDIWKAAEVPVRPRSTCSTLAFYARWLPAGLEQADRLPGLRRTGAGGGGRGDGLDFRRGRASAPLALQSKAPRRSPCSTGVMGMLAAVLTSATAVYAVAIARNRGSRGERAARTALVLGRLGVAADAADRLHPGENGGHRAAATATTRRACRHGAGRRDGGGTCGWRISSHARDVLRARLRPRSPRGLLGTDAPLADRGLRLFARYVGRSRPWCSGRRCTGSPFLGP